VGYFSIPSANWLKSFSYFSAPDGLSEKSHQRKDALEVAMNIVTGSNKQPKFS